ncbi:MAG: prepilin peptidase [Lachnospiraceae bacterium]|jgi:leader peptidase (prepilin peptidase)/N-methyltransferase
MDYIAWILTLSGLIVLAFFDVRTRHVPLIALLLLLAAGIVFSVLRQDLLQAVTGLLPGLFLCLLSFLTGGQVGYGDGIFYLAAGLLLGGMSCLAGLVFSLLLSSVTGALLLALKKATRKSRLPFLLFSALGFAGAFGLFLGGAL